jgi:hypothetical protein
MQSLSPMMHGDQLRSKGVLSPMNGDPTAIPGRLTSTIIKTERRAERPRTINSRTTNRCKHTVKAVALESAVTCSRFSLESLASTRRSRYFAEGRSPAVLGSQGDTLLMLSGRRAAVKMLRECVQRPLASTMRSVFPERLMNIQMKFIIRSPPAKLKST